MLFLAGIALGLALGLVTGGRIENLAMVRFRWPLLLVAAVLVREAILVTPLNTIDGAQYVYLLALVVIVGWANWHWRRVAGIWVVSIGASLNVLVIAANGARMPVARSVAGVLVKRGTLGQYTLMGHGTNLNPLGDWLKLPLLPEVYSIGDVIIAVGLAIVMFLALRNSPPA